MFKEDPCRHMKWLSASQEIEMKEEQTKSIQDAGSIRDSHFWIPE